MTCGKCNRDVPKLFESPASDVLVCGCCQVTLARRFPGVHGLEYPYQVNPNQPNPVKDTANFIKALQKSKNPRERFTDDEAAFLMHDAKKQQEQLEAYSAAVPKKMQEAEADYAVQAEVEQTRELQQAQEQTRRKLEEAQPWFNALKEQAAQTP